MDYEKHRDGALAGNKDLQEGLLKVTVERYLYHDKRRREKDKMMAKSYLRRANELADKYGLQNYLKDLLNG